MSEFNFDKMKNLEIPDTWVDGALNVPPKKKLPVICVNFRRVATAVACLLVVCLVGFIPFIINPDNDILPVATKSTDPTSHTVVDETSDNTDVSQTEEDQEQTQKPSENMVVNIQTETPNPSTNTEVMEPSESTQASETIIPDSSTTEPTQVDTQATQPSIPEVILPTNDSPEDSSGPDFLSGDCIVSVSPSFLVGSGNIYCKIKDESNIHIGDNHLYSQQHVASFYSGFGSVYYYLYSPQKAGLVLEPGTYYYYFYNEHSVPICKATVVIN